MILQQATSMYLVVGLPHAGKTTFLAALWHVAEDGQVPGCLRATGYPADIEHLNAIRDQWLAVNPTARTIRGADKQVRMHLSSTAGDSADIVLPDMSGESFQQQWKDRKWSAPYAEQVRSCNGVALFIHPYHVYPHPRIDEVEGTASVLADTAGTSGETTSNAMTGQDAGQTGTKAASAQDAAGAKHAEEGWDPDKCPTDVVVVDLLQMILAGRPIPSQLKLAILVSAWDTLDRMNISPQAWIERYLPLLTQFVSTNDDVIAWKTFGISAHGGDPEEDAEALRRVPEPHTRIRVVGGEGSPNDITWPLRWLMT